MPLAGGAVFRGSAGSPLGWRGPAPQQFWVILQDAVRLPLSALAFAVAFAAGGQRRRDDVSLLLTLRETRLRLGRGRFRLGGVGGVTAPSFWLSLGELGVSETMAQWGHAEANPLAWLKLSPPCHSSLAPGQPARSQDLPLQAGGGGGGGRRICDLQSRQAAGPGHPSGRRRRPWHLTARHISTATVTRQAAVGTGVAVVAGQGA